MSRRALLALLCPVVAVALVVFAAQRTKTNRPITPGPDTTVITGPLDAGGLIDYETALNERLRGTITPDTNAVVLLLKCIGPKPEGKELPPDFHRWLGTAPPPAEGEYLVSLFRHFGEEYRRENAATFDDRQTRRLQLPWTEADDPEFAEFIATNQKPLAAAVEASRRPGYYHPFVARDPDGNRRPLFNVLLPLPQRTRDVPHLLTLRAMLRCGQGRYDDAWEDVMTTHRLGRLLGRGASLTERLVGLALGSVAANAALRILEEAKPTAATALAWRDQLAALPPMPPLADSVGLTERYLFLDGMQFIRRDRTQFKEYLDPRAFENISPGAIPQALARVDWNRALRLGNRWFDRAGEAVRQPTRAERRAALATVESYRPDLIRMCVGPDADQQLGGSTGDPFADRLVTLFLPAVTRISEADDRHESQLHTELVALALAAHRADHGKYPAKLVDLMPKYAKAIPDDLYSGKSLIYKPRADGYELYSVGPNGTDDGGQSLEDEPRGDDYGVRVPNVKRVPPPPPGDGE